MQLSLFIAKRYLFSRKKQNAINIISAISVMGVAIGTGALIVILSVFNGMDLFLQKSTESLTPDLVIAPAEGKFAVFDSVFYVRFQALPDVKSYEPVVEETALLKYGENLKPVTVKGVTADFKKHTSLDSNVVEGVYSLKTGDLYTAVVGYGIAAGMRIGLNFKTPLRFYYPNKKSSGMSHALHSEYLFPAGFFSSQQEIDGKFVLTDIGFARKLFGLGDEISKIEFRLKNPNHLQQVKKQLKEIVGAAYRVEDKYELNRSFYAMMKSEKLAVFFIFVFFLMIASFNIVGSISMLILDKKEDLTIYKALGMPVAKMIAVFRTEGNLITVFGAFIGLAVGILLCYLQQTYGFIRFGDGSYIISYYPVKLVWSDIVMILFTVLTIGYLASFFPVRYLVRRLMKTKGV